MHNFATRIQRHAGHKRVGYAAKAAAENAAGF